MRIIGGHQATFVVWVLCIESCSDYRTKPLLKLPPSEGRVIRVPQPRSPIPASYRQPHCQLQISPAKLARVTRPDTLGIIAGNRSLPLLFARHARRSEERRVGKECRS